MIVEGWGARYRGAVVVPRRRASRGARCALHHAAGLPRPAALALALAVALPAGAVAGVRDGDRALEAGRLEEALRHYREAAAGGSAAAQAGVGRVWLRRGRLGEAAAAFARALEMDPRLPSAHYGRGETLRRQGRCAEALPSLERAVDLDRKLPEAQLALGRCLVAVGRFEDGLRALERGLKWGSDWAPRFLVARGAAWMARDSLRQAGIDFTRARELAPRDPAVRRAVGEFYLERGTWALAVPELRAAVELDSSDAESLHGLARAHFYSRQYPEALATYRALVARVPDYAPGLLGLGDLLVRAAAADPRRWAEAEAPLAAYVRLEPEEGRGWSLLGRARYHLGERDSALAALTRAASLGDSSRDLHTTMGLIHADREEWGAARAALERGDPGPRELPILAQIYERTGAPARADSLYGVVLAGDSTSRLAAFAYGQRGKLRFRQRDFDAASRDFRRATALDGASGEDWFYRGLSDMELGRDAQALEALEEAARIDSAAAERFFWLGVLHDRMKRTGEAERAFRRATELERSPVAGKAYRQLGYYRLRERRWAAAIPLLQRAVELDERDAQAWLWLGQAHQNTGNRARAAEGYRRTLALDPGNREAQKGLRAVGR